MAKKKNEVAKSVNPLVKYLRETRAEIAKVTWPTRQEWVRLSGIVIAVTLFMALLLGITDAVAAQIMNLILY
ncbi:MAG TPA: preprotein translocase subunit SecE [Anaerolineae bacterium]|nr:preprotein translocase subunit SecE [Anaerolineae bacterium]